MDRQNSPLHACRSNCDHACLMPLWHCPSPGPFLLPGPHALRPSVAGPGRTNSHLTPRIHDNETEIAHIDDWGVGQDQVPIAIHEFLEHLPAATRVEGITVVIVALFFATSSDSASLVVDILCVGDICAGPTRQSVFSGSRRAPLLLRSSCSAMKLGSQRSGRSSPWSAHRSSSWCSPCWQRWPSACPENR